MGEQFALRNNQIFVLAEAAGGVYNSDQLRVLCEVADNESAFLKITEDQRIGFMLDPAKLPDIQAQVRKSGLLLRSYKAAGVPSPRACLGELCTFAHQPSLGDALELATHLLKSFPSPKRYSSIGVNGCGRACLGSSTEDVHVVAEESGYKISIGGKGSEIPQQAQLLIENVSRADLPIAIEKILSVFYQESQDGERILDVIERIGLTPFLNAMPEHLSSIPETSNFAVNDSEAHASTPNGADGGLSSGPVDSELDSLIDSSDAELGASSAAQAQSLGDVSLENVTPQLATASISDSEVPEGLLEEAEFEDGTLEDVERVRDAIRTELNMSPPSEVKESAKHTDLFDELEGGDGDPLNPMADATQDPLLDAPMTDEKSPEDQLAHEMASDEALGIIEDDSLTSDEEKVQSPAAQRHSRSASKSAGFARNSNTSNIPVSGRLAIKFMGDQLGVELPSGMCFELPFDAVPEGAEFSMLLPDGELRMERHGSTLDVHLGALNMHFPIPNASEDRAA